MLRLGNSIPSAPINTVIYCVQSNPAVRAHLAAGGGAGVEEQHSVHSGSDGHIERAAGVPVAASHGVIGAAEGVGRRGGQRLDQRNGRQRKGNKNQVRGL